MPRVQFVEDAVVGVDAGLCEIRLEGDADEVMVHPPGYWVFNWETNGPRY